MKFSFRRPKAKKFHVKRHNDFLLFEADAFINTATFEIYDWLKRCYTAYSDWIQMWRVRGQLRLTVEFSSEAVNVGLIAAIAACAVAIPPFDYDENIWDRGRQYSITFTDETGEIIGTRGVRQNDAIPLNEIPDHMLQALLATEDSRFYQHIGIDPQSVIRAAVANAQAKTVVQGGSTLTQQLAKNLFLSSERSLKRKVHEAFLAMWIEARLSKDQILKLYLERSYMGGGNFGVEAAAQFYFGKSIRDVQLAEAAMLAGLYKAPSKYAPHVNLQAAVSRASIVLQRMHEVGYIDEHQLLSARQNPARVVPAKRYSNPGYFLDWAYEETLKVLKEQGIRNDHVIEVETTIDQDLQAHARDVVRTLLDKYQRRKRVDQGALVAMTPGGAVRAIVGGRDYEHSRFNRATKAMRQPGSSFKPFVYLAALQEGLRPQTKMVDKEIKINGWSPKNYNKRYRGSVTLTRALRHSINTVPVKIALDIGANKVIETAKSVGYRTRIRAVSSMALGTNETTVMNITGAYATFANGGKLAKPYVVAAIRRPNGDLLYSRSQNAPELKQVVKPSHIADLNYMMNQVILGGTGRKADLGFTAQAGKTGTTQSYRDAWFVGFTGHMVTGVWYGNDDAKSTRRLTGGDLPALTWKKVMQKALSSEVALALPGLPLTERHARYNGKDDIELLIASLPEDSSRRSARSSANRPSKRQVRRRTQKRRNVLRPVPVNARPPRKVRTRTRQPFTKRPRRLNNDR